MKAVGGDLSVLAAFIEPAGRRRNECVKNRHVGLDVQMIFMGSLD
jgi:hypothetical protein